MQNVEAYSDGGKNNPHPQPDFGANSPGLLRLLIVIECNDEENQTNDNKDYFDIWEDVHKPCSNDKSFVRIFARSSGENSSP